MQVLLYAQYSYSNVSKHRMFKNVLFSQDSNFVASRLSIIFRQTGSINFPETDNPWNIGYGKANIGAVHPSHKAGSLIEHG